MFFIGWAIAELLTIPCLMSRATADTSAAIWTLGGFSLVSLLLFIYSAWLCYIDEMREAYIDDAQHYKTHGW